MPEVKRQLPPRPEKKPSSNGADQIERAGILASAIPVEDIEDDYLKVVIYGANRVGKTTLACQFEKPLLLISFEPRQAGGAKSVKKIEGVHYLRITSTQQAIELAKELRSDRNYKTHLIDTVTSAQDVVLQELMGLEEAPVQLNWGVVTMDQYRERSEKTKELLRLFANLPVNTIFTAQEKDHNPPKEDKNKILRGLQLESFFAADLGSATVKWLHDSCDYIAQLYQVKEVKETEREFTVGGKTVKRKEVTETGKIVRRLRTMYHPNYAAGFRSENPESVPEYIEAVTPEQMYQAIVDVISGKKTKYGYYPNEQSK